MICPLITQLDPMPSGDVPLRFVDSEGDLTPAGILWAGRATDPRLLGDLIGMLPEMEALIRKVAATTKGEDFTALRYKARNLLNRME